MKSILIIFALLLATLNINAQSSKTYEETSKDVAYLMCDCINSCFEGFDEETIKLFIQMVNLDSDEAMKNFHLSLSEEQQEAMIAIPNQSLSLKNCLNKEENKALKDDFKRTSLEKYENSKIAKKKSFEDILKIMKSDKSCTIPVMMMEFMGKNRF